MSDDEFEDTTNALQFTPASNNILNNAPNVQTTDALETQILTDLSSYDYPITAAFIASHLNTSKSDINKKLYRMLQNSLVEKLSCIPPLWRGV